MFPWLRRHNVSIQVIRIYAGTSTFHSAYDVASWTENFIKPNMFNYRAGHRSQHVTAWTALIPCCVHINLPMVSNDSQCSK